MAESLADKLKAAKARQAAAGSRPKPQSYSLDSDDADAPKVLIYGPTGSGKTHFLLGALLNNEKVFGVSSDFGSNGTSTIKMALKAMGRTDLLSNYRGIDLSTYEDIEDFFINPEGFVPDIAAYRPTVMAWEGFSTFNIDILDEYILSFAPGAENAGELRKAGFTHTNQDWQGMKRGTVRTMRKFLSCQIPGLPPMAKVLTVLEDGKIDVNSLTGKAEKSVLVHGSGKTLMGPAFDAILNAFVDDKGNFKYRCAGDTSKYLVKSRGYNLKPLEDADPARIWKIIRAGEPKQNDGQKAA